MSRLALAALALLTAMPAFADPPATPYAAPATPGQGAPAEAAAAPPPAGEPSASGEDPYLWLEDVTGEKALDWVRARNAESARVLDASPAFAPLEKRLLAILDSKARIPYVEKLGRWYYNFWRDAKNPRGLWRRTSLAEFKKATPAWETVLDLDALGKAEKEAWVWHGANCLKPGYKRCLLSLSRAGADASVVREFDLERKAFVKGGFALPEAKSRVDWADADTIWVGTDFGPGTLTDSGYPRLVKLWKRATPLEAAELVYEGRAADMSVSGYSDLTRGFERQVVNRAMTFFSNETFLRRGGRLVKLDKPDSAEASFHRELLLLQLRDPWTVDGATWPAGALLAIEVEKFLAGSRAFTALFTPTERTSLAGFTATRHHLLLEELDNVRSRISVLTRGKDGSWKRAPLPGLPPMATAGVSAVDDEASDDYFLTVSDFLTPTTLSLGTVGKGPATRLKSLPTFFNAAGLAVTQHEATSADGTRIPYFQVARSGLKLDGHNPTLLYGYGGFEIPELPGYHAKVGAAWLELGGVFVVANIRGGGEFGPRWHQAALKANRPRAYEDFIAVAEDLVRRGVTGRKNLGAMGGSNGGLLVGNMLTRRPDLFGAIVCQVPLLDMKRYSHLLAGASWMDEYGDPDDPAQWAFIKGFSPYQNLEEGVNYPPTLLTTSTRDDRVHPGHARKMTARLLELKQPVLYYENIEGGHGGAANNAQEAHMSALAWTFLWQKLR